MGDIPCSPSCRRDSSGAVEEDNASANRAPLAYLAGILLVTEVGFLFIKKFPVLLAVETSAIIIAWVVRWKTVERGSGT